MMTCFIEIMETLNEKKTILIRNNLDKARKVLEIIANRPVVNLGQYTFQKKVSYTMVRPIPIYKRRHSKSSTK